MTLTVTSGLEWLVTAWEWEFDGPPGEERDAFSLIDRDNNRSGQRLVLYPTDQLYIRVRSPEDARLIAAAPELLDALRNIGAVASPTGIPSAERLAIVAEHARNAISKATKDRSNNRYG